MAPKLSPPTVAVILVVGSMVLILLSGILALILVSPEFVQATWEGLQGGEHRMAVLLFVLQLSAYGSIAAGLVYVVYRRMH